MAKILQLRKGTTQENDLFIGSEAELTYDSTAKDLRIHDGISDHRGGFRVRSLIDAEYPSVDNNYTWYFQYSDGWVEQGGKCLTGSNKKASITLPIEMADVNYTVMVTMAWAESATGQNEGVQNIATTGFDVTSSTATTNGWWEVKGLCA